MTAKAKLQVGRAIVCFIAVDVVNSFGFRQRATQCAGHDQAVFENVATRVRHREHRVIGCDVGSDIGARFDSTAFPHSVIFAFGYLMSSGNSCAAQKAAYHGLTATKFRGYLGL